MVTDDTHIYGWIGRFFASPSQTIADAVEVLSRKGYFDLSVLYKQFVDPVAGGGILYYPNVGLWLFFIGFFLIVNAKSKSVNHDRHAFSRILNPISPVFYKSFKSDVIWFFMYLMRAQYLIIRVVGILLFLNWIPKILAQFTWYGNGLSGYLGSVVGERYLLEISFVLAYLAYDYGKYLTHLALHKFDWLWAFHRVHHYPQQLNILATHRAHPVDGFLQGLVPVFFGTLVYCLMTGERSGEWVYLDSMLSEHRLFYLLIFIPATIGVLSHSALPISFGPYFSKIFVSPQDHMIHHSRKVRGKNLGSLFIFWDIFHGTHYHVADKACYLEHRSDLGSDDADENYYKSFWSQLVEPFKESFLILRDLFPRIPRI